MSLFLPIRGKIAAGSPIEPIKTHKILDLTHLLLGENRFVLQVVGDSMSGDSICDGDYIICERTKVAEDNDIVVAVVNKFETTLKRIRFTQNDTVTLVPSNPKLSATTYPRKAIKIEGVYLGLIRLTDSEKLKYSVS